MAVSASRLRQDIYRLLDEVLETGVPLEIERKGRRLRIVPAQPVSRVAQLEPHPDAFVGDIDDILTIDWMAAWRPDV